MTLVAACRATQDSELGLGVAPRLFVYVNVALVIASLAATYVLLVWLGFPQWVFVVVVVTLLAMVYPMGPYQAAGESTGEDDDDTLSWASGPDPVDKPSAAERAVLVAGAVHSSVVGARPGRYRARSWRSRSD